MLSFRKVLACITTAIVSLTLNVSAAEDRVEHDKSKLSIFVQPSVSFLDFENRKYFQNAVDTIYKSFRESAVTESESLNVAKQDFQKVNFCFPISAGLQYQVLRDHFISAGIGFIYDNESVVLTDRKNRTHNYSYTIQGVPLFLEYRLAIPKNFLSLSNSSLFSIAARWYWVLPGTEIYTTWGMLEAKTPLSGAGFGISLGYLVASWKGFNIYGDIGFSSISVESDKKFSDIVPDGPEEKAKWNVGGLQMQFRVSFGLWNDKKIEDDEEKKNSPQRNRSPKEIVEAKKTAKAAESETNSEGSAAETKSADNAEPAASTAATEPDATEPGATEPDVTEPAATEPAAKPEE
ncbi:MAG: hypothetical protein MJZ25_01275 [Fibrobacter sp.]|nr:hypothetical protein [Fibrobacter sp.]